MSGLDEFEPMTDLPPDFMMLIYGMRRSGKTTALMHMLESMKQRFEKHESYVICGTGCDNPKQWNNFPRTSVFTDISKINERVNEIIEEQREAIVEEVKRQFSEKRMKHPEAPNQNRQDKPVNETLSALNNNVKKKPPKTKKRKRDNVDVIPAEPEKPPDNDLERFPGELHQSLTENKELTTDDIIEIRRTQEIDETLFPHKLIILDDVVSENQIRHAPALNQLAVSGRHLFITVIILSQCVCGSGSVPPTIRNNADYVLVAKNPRSRNERKLLEEQYLTTSMEEAKCGGAGLRILQEVTAVKFRILAISVSSDGNKFKDYLFTYGPVPAPPDNVSKGFRLGTDKQWEKDSKTKREPRFTSKDFLKDPPKGPDLQNIDSGRFSVGHRHGVPGDVHQSKGIERFVSRHSEFLDPYF
jgi:hypothetical protein